MEGPCRARVIRASGALGLCGLAAIHGAASPIQKIHRYLPELARGLADDAQVRTEGDGGSEDNGTHVDSGELDGLHASPVPVYDDVPTARIVGSAKLVSHWGSVRCEPTFAVEGP